MKKAIRTTICYKPLRAAAALAMLASLLTGCGGGGGASASAPASSAGQKYQISGILTGLNSGASVALSVNSQKVTLSQNGGFTTTAALPTNTAYSVTVAIQPGGETCSVTNGTGTIGTSNVINVAVACTANPQTTYTVGGAVTGLNGTLLLLNNSSDAVTVSTSGTFAFQQTLFDKATYDVMVGAQPAGQTCTVTNGAGTIAAANVTSVNVSCINNPQATSYTLGGTVSGLTTGGTVVLTDGQSISITANGTYTFSSALPSGGSYNVTVGTQPTGQTCSVANAAGTMSSSNVTNVNVTCAAKTYSISGGIAGLTTGAGISVVLQDNGGDNLTLTNNGIFTFSNQVTTSANYNVTVLTQPANHQTCTVSNATGIISGDVTTVAVACAPGSQFVYVANEGGSTVSAYSIGANGALTQVTGSPFAADSFPRSVTVNPAGTFAYVANFLASTVSAYSVDPYTGALTQVPGSPFATVANATSVTVNPAGTFVYVANQGSNNISAYSIGTNGALTAVTGSPFATGSGPESVTVNPAGTFAYVANFSSNTVSAYSIGANGALTQVTGSPFATGIGPESVTVNPAGTFAYVSNYGADTISAYSINASTGVLTPVTGSPFTAGTFPTSVTVNSAGTFAYVSNYGNNTVSAYSINASTGALTPITGSPVAAGSGPESVTVNPAGTFAYVANFSSNTVSAYSINPSTGALTPVGIFAAGTHPSSVTVTQP